MFFYIFLGYITYGAILAVLAYSRGELGKSKNIWRFMGAIIREPLSVHFLSPGHWGNVEWLTAGKGVLLLCFKVGALALMWGVVISRVRKYFLGIENFF